MISIILIDPKFAINVGNARRACACYGADRLLFSGRRAYGELQDAMRTPRPMRMRAYEGVEIVHNDNPLAVAIGEIVAVEVRENAEALPWFTHPKDAAYVFGPEDGSLSRATLMRCHRFVQIPTAHCLNLATAVATVLYDRTAKNFVGDAKLLSTANYSETSV